MDDIKTQYGWHMHKPRVSNLRCIHIWKQTKSGVGFPDKTTTDQKIHLAENTLDQWPCITRSSHILPHRPQAQKNSFSKTREHIFEVLHQTLICSTTFFKVYVNPRFPVVILWLLEGFLVQQKKAHASTWAKCHRDWEILVWLPHSAYRRVKFCRQKTFLVKALTLLTSSPNRIKSYLQLKYCP